MLKLLKCALCLGLIFGITGCKSNDNDKDTNSNVSLKKEEKKKNVIKADNGTEIDLNKYIEEKDFINYEFEEEDDESITLRRYNGNIDYLILPKEYNGKKITNIYGAFAKSNIKGIIIPEGYINIGHSAFDDCSRLETVIMPDSVVSLSDVFDNCSSLENIRLSKNIKAIVRDTFDRHNKLKKVVIPASVETVYDGAFWCCESLETVVYEEGIKEINAEAFYVCKKLYNIFIPSSVTMIKGEFGSVDIHPNIIFHVEKDSYAEQYAKDNGFNVEYN